MRPFLAFDICLDKYRGIKESLDGTGPALIWEAPLGQRRPHHGSSRREYLADFELCGRRVRKLYLGPGKSGFACRTCLGLTYQSAQEHDKRLGIFRRYPKALEAAMKAGSFLAWKFMLKNAFRVPRRLTVTITGDSDAMQSRGSEKPA